MALSTGSGIVVFDSAVTAISQTTAIASSAFSAGTITAVVSEAPLADAVLDIQMASAPVAGKSIHLYRRDLNISGANDAAVPNAAYKSIYVGSFPLALVGTRQYISLPDIPLSPDQEFYLENSSAVATTGTTVLTIKPKSYNAKA